MDRFRQFSAKHRLLRYAAALMFIGAVLPAEAGTLERAKRMHDRLTGVPATDVSPSFVLSSMQAKLATGVTSDAIDAAYIAMNNPAFYNATLKNWITPWTNRDDDKFAPLNDYTATVIGIIRDERDYREVLDSDILYVPNPGTYGAYSNGNNNAYAALEAADGDMGNTNVLQLAASQSSVTGLPSTATAGVITTRAAARAFFIDGTNRAMFRFTLKNHLCNDMEQVQDITRPADRIRQDVTRSPGGDSRIFMNTCVGCHSGMDPMAQAFAYYDFSYTNDPDSGNLVFTPGQVNEKYFINDKHFTPGFVTPNDRWDNYWRSGPNTAIFGWDNAGTGTGHGARQLGHELAYSQAFAVCSVKKVFKVVCLRDPVTADQSAFTTMLSNFNSSHNLKHTFAEAAVHCSGQ